ncbi:uroporphyrinogen decarboxylase family protein [uncultured Robinsoniella sp.]|uniref:uroporphyrinogen decarboxylase family protein n=1 Tax=uncultured Robinsoniella sp. TaxID=904190 RepID=UPI00374F8D6A
MNSYERAVTVLNGGIPDRVPTFELMIDPKVIRGIIGTDDYMQLCEELDIDIVISQTPSRLYREEVVDAEKKIVRNEWGMLRQYNSELVSLPLHGPIETLEDALHYKAPDPNEDFRFDYLRELVRRFKGKRLIGFHLHDGFNYSYYLSSMEDMMCNLFEEPELIHKLVEISIEHNLKLAEKAIDLGADFILTGDDYGTKTSLLLSKDHFNEFFLPGLKKICDLTLDKGAFMLKHCCGNINSLIGDFTDFGIKGLHPLDENSGISQVEVKKKYPGLTVMGGIDCDEPLTNYTPEKMEDYVKEILKTHAPGGRYVCASSNSVHSSAKPENFVAMQRAVHKYGRYLPNGELDL